MSRWQTRHVTSLERRGKLRQLIFILLPEWILSVGKRLCNVPIQPMEPCTHMHGLWCVLATWEVGHLRLEAIYCTYKQAMHKLVRLAGNRQGPWTSTSLAQSRPKLDLPPSPFGCQGVGWGHSMYGTSYQLEQSHLDHIRFCFCFVLGAQTKQTRLSNQSPVPGSQGTDFHA